MNGEFTNKVFRQNLGHVYIPWSVTFNFNRFSVEEDEHCFDFSSFL